MIWLNPPAWFALVAVAAPILVHLLAHRRAERVPFPTLRFIPATRLAAIRRRALDDRPLLAVRVAIIAAAVAAFAGPLVTTAARRAAWNARTIRAVVMSSTAARRSAPDPATGSRENCGVPDCRLFEAAGLTEGLRRAVAWLDVAPPGRREIVIAAPLTLGSLRDADVAAVPAGVGLRFDRTGVAVGSRTVSLPPLMTPAGTVQRSATLEGGRTSVREQPATHTANGSWSVEIAAPPERHAGIEAARNAVLSLRVEMPPLDRRVRLALVRSARETAVAGAAPIRAAWMADVAARLARDPALQAEAEGDAGGLADRAFDAPPWQRVATAAAGDPSVAAATSASDNTLLIAARADASDLLIAVVLRAIAAGLAPQGDLASAEVLPIPDRQLRAWTRDAGPAAMPRPDSIDRDDRRWLWTGVLVLLAIESWMRRTRRDAADAIENRTARVA